MEMIRIAAAVGKCKKKLPLLDEKKQASKEMKGRIASKKKTWGGQLP